MLVTNSVLFFALRPPPKKGDAKFITIAFLTSYNFTLLRLSKSGIQSGIH